MPLEYRHTGHGLEPAPIVGDLPALALVGAEHHHQFVDQLAELVAHVGKLAIVRHPQHHVGQHLRTQIMPAPDVVAQIVIEFLPGRRPDQLQLEAQATGQGLGHFVVDPARLAILLEAVRRKILIEGDLEYTRLDDRVVAAHRRLRLDLRGQHTQQRKQQQDTQAHSRHSSIATLSR
ncbi:hypothetical protein FQZ97_1034980 [compost metagenome]